MPDTHAIIAITKAFALFYDNWSKKALAFSATVQGNQQGINMNLINQILTDTNLYNAWIKVQENQGCAGIDGVSLTDFANKLWLNLETLAQEVKYNQYHPKPLLRVEIDKPCGGGSRPLSIPVIRDRVLQTAVALVLTPLFEAEFEDISFAYRKGRSVNQAIARIEQLHNLGYQWVVDANIQSFFDQIEHGLIMQEVAQLVDDQDILRLIRLWLKATIVDDKQRYKLHKGISQGSPISPMLANLYLDRLDKALLDQQYKIIRYADDFVILCKSEKQAKRALALSSEVLEQLRLCFNQSKTRITHFNRGFRFLGVDFIRSLAIKSKPDIPLDLIQPAKPVKKPNKPKPEKQNQEILTEMQQAFLQAGINPGQFIHQPPASSPLPSESEEPEALEVQASEEPGSSRYDPRLKTLYLLKHGMVLGKESERFVLRFQGVVQQEIPLFMSIKLWSSLIHKSPHKPCILACRNIFPSFCYPLKAITTA